MRWFDQHNPIVRGAYEPEDANSSGYTTKCVAFGVLVCLVPGVGVWAGVVVEVLPGDGVCPLGQARCFDVCGVDSLIGGFNVSICWHRFEDLSWW